MLEEMINAIRGKQAGAGRGFVNPPTVEEVEKGKRMRE